MPGSSDPCLCSDHGDLAPNKEHGEYRKLMENRPIVSAVQSEVEIENSKLRCLHGAVQMCSAVSRPVNVCKSRFEQLHAANWEDQKLQCKTRSDCGITSRKSQKRLSYVKENHCRGQRLDNCLTPCVWTSADLDRQRQGRRSSPWQVPPCGCHLPRN